MLVAGSCSLSQRIFVLSSVPLLRRYASLGDDFVLFVLEWEASCMVPSV